MPKLDETENEFRYRIKDPGLFAEGMFKSKSLPKPGLRLILGRLKSDQDGSSVAQSVRFDKKNWDRSEALAWVHSNKEDFKIEPAELFSIKDVEIFSVGRWNGKEFSVKDLDNIVEAFSKTKNVVRPFLKLGHDDDQKVLQSSGLPAAGWVENVRRTGNKLAADFVDIPKKIFQLIKNKAYRKVSCEIYNNIKLENATFPKMLGAVALLGSDLPGVLNLNDILSLYIHDHNFSSVESFTNEKSYDIIIGNEIENKKDKDLSVMPELEKLKFQLEEAQKKTDELDTKFKTQGTEIEKYKADLKLVTDQKAEAEVKILEAQEKEKAAQVDKFIGELTTDKLCTKAMQPLVKELFSDKTEKFSIGDKEVSKFELVKEILKSTAEGAKVNFEDKTSGEGDKVDLNDKIEKYSLENKVSYDEAYRILSREK